MSLYYSWFSITPQLNNNQFTFNFPNGAGNTTYTVNITSGTYTVEQLNNKDVSNKNKILFIVQIY